MMLAILTEDAETSLERVRSNLDLMAQGMDALTLTPGFSPSAEQVGTFLQTMAADLRRVIESIERRDASACSQPQEVQA